MKRSIKAAGAKAPSPSRTAEVRMFKTGKNTKTATSAMMPPIELTTKTSPFTAPRAARPWVKHMRSAAATSRAP